MMGTVSFEVPGPGTYQVTCDPKLNPLANGGSAGDVLTGKQFYNDQNQVVTGTLVPAAPTYAGVLVVTVDAGAEVTVTDGTTTLTATSTGTATFHLPNGGTWTVSAALNGSQSSPATVEVQENFSLALSAGASQTVTIPTQYEAELSFGPAYTVSVTIDPEGSGTVTGAGRYPEGASATVTATPEDGYQFTAWQENGSRLPAGYTELEYIESTGTQYVNTGVNPTTETKSVLDLKITGTETCVVFGSRVESGNRQKQYFVFTMPSTSRFEANYFYWTDANLLNLSDYTQRGILTLDQEAISFNESTAAINYTQGTESVPGPIFLFGLNENGTGANSLIKMILYSCKIYESGTLVRDFVPCSDASGAVGLYDLVGGAFYPNAGTGVFTAGPTTGGKSILDNPYTFTVTQDTTLTAAFEKIVLVTVTTSEEPDGAGTVTGAGTYVKSSKITLKASAGPQYKFSCFRAEGNLGGYKELEYILSDRACGINTGVNVNCASIRVVMDVELQAWSSGSEYLFYSHYGTSAATDRYFYVYSGSAVGIGYRYYNQSAKVLTGFSAGQRLVIDYNGPDKTFTAGEQSATITPASSSFGSTAPLYLFAQTGYSRSVKLYSAKIYTGTALMRDFIPCENPEGKIGLLDLVSGEFFTNTRTGIFTPGPSTGREYQTAPEFSFSIKENIAITAQFKPVFAEGYTAVEYIANPNLGYIYTTLINSTAPFSRRIVTVKLDLTGAEGKGIFGYSQAYRASSSVSFDNQRACGVFYEPDSHAIRSEYAYNATGSFEISDGIHEIVFDNVNYKTYVDGELANSFSSTSAASRAQGFEIFATHQRMYTGAALTYNTLVHSINNFRLYSFDINTSEGVELVNLRPCVNEAGVCGLFDIVSGTFVSSSVADSQFVAGPTL